MPTIASGPKRTDNGPQLPYSIRAETTWSFPQNLPGLSVWFDASDATTINSIGSNLVSWRSKDSNAIIMSNGNYPLGPTIIQNVRNGLPVVRFDGTNNSFISSIVSTYNSSNFTLNNQTTMFVAYNRTNNGTPFNIVDTAGRGNGARIGPQGGTFFYGNIYSGINNTRVDFTVPNDTTLGFRVDSFYAYSQTLGFRLSGSTFATSNLPTPTSFPTEVPLIVQMGGISLGGRLFTQDLGEVILYNRGLSDTEIASIEAYLAKKWATTAAFPLGHVGRTTFNTQMGFRFLTYALPISNVQLWFDAMDTAVFTDINGRSPPTPNNPIPLNSWSNKGTFGGTVIGAGGLPRPIFNIFATNRYPEVNTIQGNYSLFYDIANPARYSYTNGKNMTCFIVFRVYPGGGAQTIFALHNGASYERGTTGIYFAVIANSTQFGYSSSLTPMFFTTITTNTTYVGTIIINCNTTSTGGALPSNGIVNINGAYATNSSNIGLSNYSIDKVGLFGYFNDGTSQRNQGLNEVVCCYRAVTTQERVAMENQLLAKWGIARNAPVAYLATGVPVTSGLRMWYDAYLPAFVTTNASNQVTSWLDRSGNGFHMSNAGSNPVVYTTLTSQTASLPALQFTFSNATSNFSALQNFNISNFVTSTITTIATGFFTQNPVSALASRILSLGSTINAFEQIHNSVSINQIYNQCNLSGNYTQSNFQIRTFLANAGVTSNGLVGPSNMIYYINGSNPSSCNFIYQGMFNISNARIGASLFNINDLGNGAVRTGQGFFTEFLVWNRCLTTAELTSVHTYLFNKWSIVSNAPVASVPVTSGLTLWLDAYDPAQVVRDSTGAVWMWRDKSGCNFHFTNTNANNTTVFRPTYLPTAVGGLPGILFTSDLSTTVTTLYNLNFVYPVQRDLSIFIVFQSRRSVGRLLAVLSNNSVDYNFVGGVSITGITANRNFAVVNAAYTAGTVAEAGFIWNSSRTDIPDIPQSNLGVTRNGVVSSTGASFLGCNFTFNQLIIGSRGAGPGDITGYYDGYVSEYLIYNRTVTFPERQQIESYLLNKWNI